VLKIAQLNGVSMALKMFNMHSWKPRYVWFWISKLRKIRSAFSENHKPLESPGLYIGFSLTGSTYWVIRHC
jgi:hypothetical protein